ncbi:hypothetical protein GCM10025772_07050 [Ferrimonas gelatinilytica]|uniref:Uncharacterized protein n=1 Tax=Ferrimonas gelatinilytica TaxID=1255257 RepID=A0ABP9RVV6_9GAMM
MDRFGLDAIVKMDMRGQFHLGDRDIIQAIGGPIDHPVDLFQIDRFLSTVPFGYEKVTIHWRRALPVPCESEKRGDLWRRFRGKLPDGTPLPAPLLGYRSSVVFAAVPQHVVRLVMMTTR